MNKICNNTIN